MLSKKTVNITGIGDVQVQRKKRMKSIRLRINHSGEVVLSIPRWVMLGQAILFAKNKKTWIQEERAKHTPNIVSGQRFGKGMTVKITRDDSARVYSKLDKNTLHIRIPNAHTKQQAQRYIKRKIDETIRTQAEQLILHRLQYLSKKHNIHYNSAEIRILKSRWGSCDSKANIKLNAYLVQLPDNLIDYVLLHELNHINNMDHSKKFWADLSTLYADTDSAKKAIKQHRPILKTYVP